MNTPPTADKPEVIRLTIPVDARVHEAFTRISKATSIPLGRCMSDWMRDTIDAAEYMASQLEEARAAPRIVAQKLHAYALGAADETGAFLEMVRRKSAAPGPIRKLADGAGGAKGGHSPPVGNTGGKGRSKQGRLS
jgi:hypothetical protein